MIKKLIKDTINKLGFEIRKNQIGFNPSYLSQLCQPRTVIDVGVGYGTFPLYKAFPEAFFILIEPLKEYKNAIEKIAKKYTCDIHYKAVGDKECKREINIATGSLTKSSFLRKTLPTISEKSLEKRMVEVTTLDTIFRETPTIKGPILLKIDTEGYELSVLKGAKSLLQIVDIVIAEVSIAKRFENSYRFEDFISFMNENGFHVFSFLRILHPSGEIKTRFADIVFKHSSNAR